MKTDSKNSGTLRFYDSLRDRITKGSFVVDREIARNQRETEQIQRQINSEQESMKKHQSNLTNFLGQVEMLRKKADEHRKLKKSKKDVLKDEEQKRKIDGECKGLRKSAYKKLEDSKSIGFLDKSVVKEKEKEVSLEKVGEKVLERFESNGRTSIATKIDELTNAVNNLKASLKTRESHRAMESNPRALAFTLEVLKKLPDDVRERNKSGGDGRYWIQQQNGVQCEKEED